MTASAVSATRRTRRRVSRPRATFTSVLGELLLTAGVLVLLFVAWQMWIGDIIIAAQKNDEGAAISQQLAEDPPPPPPPLVEADDGTTYYEPVIPAAPADAEWFGQMHIPRFGADYNFGIYGGTSRARTLDDLGIGVYKDSKMPGEVGNFSMAGHRTTWGKPFNQIDKLQLNDAIVVETPDGWYTYRFRTLEYVQPSADRRAARRSPDAGRPDRRAIHHPHRMLPAVLARRAHRRLRRLRGIPAPCRRTAEGPDRSPADPGGSVGVRMSMHSEGDI